MNFKKIYSFVLFLLFPFFIGVNMQAAKALEKNVKGRNKKGYKHSSENYTHQALENLDGLFKYIDENEEKILNKVLLEMYKDGVAKPIKKKIPVYFVVGPTGSGKSTFIFALQGNKVKKVEKDDDDWDEIEEGNDDYELEFKKTVKQDTPKVAISAEGVTKGSKVYYRVEKNPMAFCDTEGLLGDRVVKTKTEKLISAFSPWFVLKSNKVGGIVVMMSASDIDSSRGKNFRVCAKFIQKYFDLGVRDSDIRKLKKSVMLLINKGDNKKKLAKQLALIIQKSYKDYYNGIPAEFLEEENQENNKKKKKETTNIGDLKRFFSIFLKEDVHQNDINNIKKFALDRKNVDFFCPYEKKNVEKTIKALSSLTPLNPRYLYTGDNPLFQYLCKKVIDIGYTISKEVNGAFDWRLKTMLQKALLEKEESKVTAFTESLKKQEKKLSDTNEKILCSDLLELVYEDRHVGSIPYSHQGKYGLLKAQANPYKDIYDEVIKKGIIEGGNLETLSGRIACRIGSSLYTALVVPSIILYSPIFVPIAAILASADYAYRGYLRRIFIYNGENPIYRIEIKTTNGTFRWKGPSERFILKNFSLNKIKDTREKIYYQYTAKERESIKENNWKIYHRSNFKKDANCYVYLYTKKKDLKASEQKIEANEDKITLIQNCIKDAHAKSKEKKKKEELEKEYIVNKNVLEEKKKLLLKHLQTMEMVYFWAQTIFGDKPSSRELIEGYTKDYEEATGKEIINKISSFDVQNIQNQEMKPTFSLDNVIEIQDEEEQKEGVEDYTFKEESYEATSTDNNNDMEIVD